jgi:glycosyltransferase involved in cell wall biosynthesis
MSTEPLFSVLIANYNNGKYLMDAINSINSQTYNNWEIIIVDDCSTDNSYDIYKEIENDSRIHIYYNSINKGCGYTKRRCAELAVGEICGFLDPDDALTEDALEIMVKSHIINDDVSIVSSRYYHCDSELNILSQSCRDDSILLGTSFLESQSAVITHFATYKNSKYKLTVGIDSSLLRAVDHDLYYLMEEQGKIKLIPEYLYYYRTGTGNNISLGDNILKAAAWDFVSIINACKRRRISPEKIMCDSLNYIIKEETDLAKEQVRNTFTYKLGQIIIFPLRLLKHFFA